jgi:hypothetical protein
MPTKKRLLCPNRRRDLYYTTKDLHRKTDKLSKQMGFSRKDAKFRKDARIAAAVLKLILLPLPHVLLAGAAVAYNPSASSVVALLTVCRRCRVGSGRIFIEEWL